MLDMNFLENKSLTVYLFDPNCAVERSQCRNVLSECPFWVQNDNFRI